MFNAYKLHAFLLKTGLHDDPLHLRRLLLACAAAAPQSLSYARSLFAHIPSPDTFAYNTLIRAHAPSSPSHALSLFFQMRLAGVSPDAFTFPFVLKACARLQLGQGLHSLIIKLAFDSNIYVQNSLISFYGCFGSVELASKLFQEMLQRDLVSWSSMIACLANNGFGLQALDLFRQMQLSASQDIKPDEITMLSVISAVSSLGGLDLGQWIYSFIRRSGLELSVSLGTALVDMYSRCGSIEESIRVFDEMPIRNLLTWTALINGLAVHGRGREALRVFYEMEKSGLRPDNITLTAVLVACSHGGLVEEGRQIFESIRNTYDMEPLAEHYGCMVDLLGRAGLLYEAYEFLKRMTMKPNSVTWRTLLGACVNHNHLELAEKVKQRISELDPHHDGDYVLLSNAYGVVGRWVEKEGVRNLMREKRISKNPGYSVIIIDQVLHEFVSGDSSHPQSEEIRTFLVSVIENLRPAGYTPHTCNVLHDIEEEDKDHSLGYHSEKMAIAFALLRSNDSRTIRIMKNLRICHDCHSFMKHVSGTFGREIIIRDRNRFHHFVGGSCSCGDYW